MTPENLTAAVRAALHDAGYNTMPTPADTLLLEGAVPGIVAWRPTSTRPCHIDIGTDPWRVSVPGSSTTGTTRRTTVAHIVDEVRCLIPDPVPYG